MSWSHYRELIRLPTVDQRRFYERAAHRGGWPVRQLQKEIRAELFEETAQRPEALPPGDDPFDGRPLRAYKGIPYTYSIRALPESAFSPGVGTEAGARLRLDVGFGKLLQVDFADLEQPRDGLVVRAEKDGTGPQARYRLCENKDRRRKLYTYPTEILRVVDGDTVEALLDCGFGLTTVETLRLRGLDAPELSQLAGQRARAFVVERLTGASVVAVTTRTGKYGRYIADLFYLPGAAEPGAVIERGIFLNRELLRHRLAVRYGD